MLNRSFKMSLCELYRYSVKDDEVGLGKTKTFEKIGEAKGVLDYVDGQKKYIADKFKNDLTHIFIIRNKRIVASSKDYLKTDGKFYEILLIDYPCGSNNTEILLKEKEGDLDV